MMFENIKIRKIEDERLLQAITSMDTNEEKADFWQSETHELILKEIQEGGWLRRHPIYTNYVVDVISGTVWRVGNTVLKLKGYTQHNRQTVCVAGKNHYRSHIVMEAFLGQSLLKPVVHHYSYMCEPDSIYNLRNTTHEENCGEPHRPRKKYEYSDFYIIKDEDVVCVAKTYKDVASFIGCSTSSVSMYLRGGLKHIKGYTIRREVKV